MARFYWSERWNVFRLRRRRLRWLDDRIRGPLRPAPPRLFFRLPCTSSSGVSPRLGCLPPNVSVVRANREAASEHWHRSGAEWVPLRNLTREHNPRRIFNASLLACPPLRLPDVGFQARDRSARPCGREGELDSSAAMCKPGKKGPLGLAKTIKKKKHIYGIGTLCWRLVDRFGSRHTYSNAVLVSRCQF